MFLLFKWKIIRLIFQAYFITATFCMYPPTFISEWTQIESQSENGLSRLSIPHTLAVTPMKVDVQIKVIDTTGNDIIFSGIGSGVRDNDLAAGGNEQSYGGVVYIYNHRAVELFAPIGYERDDTNHGRIIYISAEEWAGQMYFNLSSAEVRVRLWSPSYFFTPTYISNSIPISTGQYEQFFHGQNTYPTMVIVKLEMLDNNGDMWTSDAVGLSYSDVARTNDDSGGLVFGYDQDYIYVWTSDKNVFSLVGWGNETEDFCVQSGNVTAYAWFDSPDYHYLTISNQIISFYETFSFDCMLFSSSIVKYSRIRRGIAYIYGNRYISSPTSVIYDVNQRYGGTLFAYSSKYGYIWYPRGLYSNYMYLKMTAAGGTGLVDDTSDKTIIDMAIWNCVYPETSTVNIYETTSTSGIQPVTTSELPILPTSINETKLTNTITSTMDTESSTDESQLISTNYTTVPSMNIVTTEIKPANLMSSATTTSTIDTTIMPTSTTSIEMTTGTSTTLEIIAISSTTDTSVIMASSTDTISTNTIKSTIDTKSSTEASQFVSTSDTTVLSVNTITTEVEPANLMSLATTTSTIDTTVKPASTTSIEMTIDTTSLETTAISSTADTYVIIASSTEATTTIDTTTFKDTIVATPTIPTSTTLIALTTIETIDISTTKIGTTAVVSTTATTQITTKLIATTTENRNISTIIKDTTVTFSAIDAASIIAASSTEPITTTETDETGNKTSDFLTTAHVSTYYGINLTPSSQVENSNLQLNTTSYSSTKACNCNYICQSQSEKPTMSQILEDLSLDVTKTSAYIRRKTCANDDRPSAKYIGVVGLSILISLICLMIAFDIHRAYINLIKIMKNMRNKFDE